MSRISKEQAEIVKQKMLLQFDTMTGITWDENKDYAVLVVFFEDQSTEGLELPKEVDGVKIVYRFNQTPIVAQ